MRPPTPAIDTLSLHDALPISRRSRAASGPEAYRQTGAPSGSVPAAGGTGVTGPTEIAQLLAVFRFLMATVHPACVPVPTVGFACSEFPVVAHHATEPAGAGLA